MSCLYLPLSHVNKTENKLKDKYLFCFNPYPLSPLIDKNDCAPEGYLTQDYALDLVKYWGTETLKKCYYGWTIRESGYWPFFFYTTKPDKDAISLYDELKTRKLL